MCLNLIENPKIDTTPYMWYMYISPIHRILFTSLDLTILIAIDVLDAVILIIR